MTQVVTRQAPVEPGSSGGHVRLGRWALRISDRAMSVVTVVVALVLVVLPLGYLLYGSIRSAAPGTPGAQYTGSNWADVYLKGSYDGPLVHTLELSATVAVIAVALGVAMAWLVTRTDMPGRGWLTLVLALPVMISPLITSLAWVALAAPEAGFINSFAHQWFGRSTPLFNIYSFQGIVLVMVLHYTPYAYLAVLGALRNVDSALEEAAQMLGSSPIRTAVRMTLPLLWPTLTSAALLIFVFATDNFSVPTMLGTPVGYQTLPSELYQLLNLSPTSPTKAAAVGTLLLWVAVVGTFLQRRVLRRASRYVTVAGKSGARRPVSLGAWRWVGIAICIVYLLLAVALPYLALILGSLMSFVTPHITMSLLTLSNYQQALSPQYLMPLRNTLILCLATALVTALAGVLVSYLVQRRLPRRVAAVTDYAVMLPNAAPAMVLAIGLLWASLSLPLPVYGTLWLLAIAYFTRYLGYGARTSGAALAQLSPDLDEAARVHGASASRSFRDITLPLMRSTVLSVWTLLFVLFFLEISATILLYSPNSETIAVVLWNQLANSNQPTAFAIGVVQSTIIFVVLAIAQRIFGTMRHVAAR
jgi:iron(III) transport system permease protein